MAQQMSLSQYAERIPRKGSIVDCRYSLPLSSLSTLELQNEKKNLTIQARSGFGPAPPPFEAYQIIDDRLYVPRFYGYERFGNPEKDIRTKGDDISVIFQGTLRPVQEQAVVAFSHKCFAEKKNKGGIAVLPCGAGKTVFSLKMVSEIKKRTLVIVHTTALAEQWEERARCYLPDATIGKIQGDKLEVDKDIVIAMVMTLAKRKYTSDIMKCFGLIILDEAHHLAAPYMNTIFSYIPTEKIIALTATKERPDGLTPILHWCIGPEIFRAERESSDVMVSCLLYEQGESKYIKYNDGQPALSLMLTSLAKDSVRNDIIVKHIKRYWDNGRNIILLSDRNAQLDMLPGMLTKIGIPASDIGLFKGSVPKNQRKEELAKNIVLCTYGLANEGLDKDSLDCLILATPKARITQAVGRIQRQKVGKKTPVVLDIVDNWCPFNKLRWKRYREYTKQGFKCQTFPSSNTTCWYE
jgi:superfamily II DNA or RNA helicase